MRQRQLKADDPRQIAAIVERATPLRTSADLGPLVGELGRARIVMLGEATHGTHEFYEWRRKISERLIAAHGFSFIAVEGDWPPCWEVNRFIRGDAEEPAREVLRHFRRWPTWMWANSEVLGLCAWLRGYNEAAPEARQAGFYGLDVYSLFESVEVVLERLEELNPLLARKARARYACFERFHGDERAYAKSLMRFPEGCERQTLEVLQDLLRTRLDGFKWREDALFDARQNAKVVAGAEDYYRTMMLGAEDSWNVRDRHMLDTLEALLERHGPASKAIVWAHNTHIGDYRATDMVNEGQVNLGGLAREKWGESQVALVGFGTHEGEVIASGAWDGPVEAMRIPPGRSGSYEAAFHEASRSLGERSFFISLRDEDARSGVLAESGPHRAIGVVYQPASERFGNYVPTALSRRYDAFVFVDRTTALQPLVQGFERGEIPETWPRGQ